MKSWVHSLTAGSHTLALHEVPEPEPDADEILVRVKAASFNRGEIAAASKAPAAAEGKPAGIECAGEIVRTGSAAGDFKPGEKVLGRARMAFSEYAVLHKGDAVRVPAGLSWEEAAGASITYQVAYEILFGEGTLSAGEWLLITGVTSGVGVAALQLGKLIGAQVIGTSRSPEKLATLAERGLDYGLVYEENEFVKQVREITGEHGVDVIVNNVGGGVFANCLKVLAFQGRLATVGNMDGIGHATIDLTAQHNKRLKLFGVSNKLRSPEDRSRSVALFASDILPAMNERKIVPVIDRVFAFVEAQQGLDYMNANNQVGKIIVKL